MHTSKKILLIGINDMFIGGAQRLVIDVLKYGEFFDTDVHIVTFIEDPNRKNFLESLPVWAHYHCLDFKNYLDISGWVRAYRLLKNINPDIVWSHFFFSNTVFRLLKIIFGYRVIIVEHNTYTWKRLRHIVIDWVLSFYTDRIVAVSQTVADFTSRQEHIPESKFTVIPNGVDVARIQNEVQDISKSQAQVLLKLPQDRKYIINVARLSEQKNHILLIDSFSLFARTHPDYNLLIVGGGPLLPKLQEKVSTLGLTDRVFLLGTKMNVAQYYRASEFFVLTSKIEGFALVCIEAMACGLPVISTKVAGPDEYVKDGVNGYLVKSEEEEINKYMSLFVSQDKQEREQMKVASVSTAHMYDVGKTAQKYTTLLMSCSDTRSTSP